jgi:DNA primase
LILLCFKYQERDVIRTLVKFGNETIQIPNDEDPEAPIELSVAEYLVFEAEQDQLSIDDDQLAKIYKLYKAAVEKEQTLSEQQLVSHEDKAISSFVIECLMEKYSLSLNWEKRHNILTVQEEQILQKKVHKGICSWRLNKVQQMIEKLQESLKEQPKEYTETINEILRLEEAKRALAKELGRIILK